MAISDQLAKAIVRGIQEQMDICPHHDVIVSVDGTEFKCHRFLLSASSNFFRALFQSGMKEDLDNKVVLRNISSTIFKLIIDSVYFAKGILTSDNVSSVWHAVSQLQIGYLMEACEIFQSKRLSRENCVSIRNDSKLLNSKKLQDLSWDVIVKEFDVLRKGDNILFLGFDDMKRLVGYDNLTIPSEDVIIETIMRWVRFNPNEYLLEGLKDGNEFYVPDQQESKDDKKLISIDSMKKELKDVKAQSKNKPEHSDKLLRNRYGSSGDVFFIRREFLSELLAASKLLLVSGSCLQKLLENKMVLEDPKSFALVREGTRYHLQPGSRQSFCPLNGIYRNTSLLENVIFTILGTECYCRTLKNEWYLLSTDADTKCRAVAYGNDIYATASTGSHQNASKYEPLSSSWRQIALLNVPRQDHALVCLDNYIYAIGGINCTSIERFEVEAEQKVPGSGTWENFGNLLQPMTNLMATTCNHMIVIFGSESEDNPSTFVQTFNPQTISANIFMNNMSGSAKNMVSFRHGEDTFVLQENGALWKVNLDSNLLLNIEFHTMLWTDPFTLMGAVVTNQELVVFGDGIDPQMSREWEVCNFEHFKRIKIIEQQGYNFLNTVIPKKLLVSEPGDDEDGDDEDGQDDDC